MQETKVGLLTDFQARQLIREELNVYFSENPLTFDQASDTQKVVDLDGLLQARPFIGSRSTVYKKVSAGEIPHSKSGKRLIFDLQEIDEWLLSNKIKTSQEIEEETNNYLRRGKRRGVKNG